MEIDTQLFEHTLWHIIVWVICNHICSKPPVTSLLVFLYKRRTGSDALEGLLQTFDQPSEDAQPTRSAGHSIQDDSLHYAGIKKMECGDTCPNKMPMTAAQSWAPYLPCLWWQMRCKKLESLMLGPSSPACVQEPSDLFSTNSFDMGLNVFSEIFSNRAAEFGRVAAKSSARI